MKQCTLGFAGGVYVSVKLSILFTVFYSSRGELRNTESIQSNAPPTALGVRCGMLHWMSVWKVIPGRGIRATVMGTGFMV